MTDLATLLQQADMKPAELARRIGRSRSHLSHVLAGRKQLSLSTAIAIWREMKWKLGPIASTSDADIKALARFDRAA